jgi:hypothetical protein
MTTRPALDPAPVIGAGAFRGPAHAPRLRAAIAQFAGVAAVLVAFDPAVSRTFPAAARSRAALGQLWRPRTHRS